VVGTLRVRVQIDRGEDAIVSFRFSELFSQTSPAHEEKKMRHAGDVKTRLHEVFDIPTLSFPISTRLPAGLAVLREEALNFHQRVGTVMPPVPEITLSDAAAWAARQPDEDWLIWRGRLAAERLRRMPVELEAGERIVGRPRFRVPGPEEETALDAARRLLADVPPFPGGDAGHLHPDYEKLFRLGVGGLLDEIMQYRERADRAGDAGRITFYDACRIALDGMSAYIGRVADACAARATAEPEEEAHWREMAAICRHVATEPPRTFHEAIELLFLALTALWQGESHGLTSPGRLDRTLLPFYEADRAAGRISPQAAFELIVALYIQVNRIMPTGVALAVMVGGRDEKGRDLTNDLTYLCIAARIVTGLSYPTVGLCWHRGTPPELMDFCVGMLAHGRGDPAFFNDELIVEGLLEHGVSAADAPDYMNSTCVEIKPVGRSNIWVTQPYFNVPQALLDVMDEVAGGERMQPETFEALEASVRDNLASKVAAAAARLNQAWRARTTKGCFPLASCFTNDCLERGLDFDRGGARYNWVENSFVGLANLADGLVAVKRLVYEERALTLAQFAAVLREDFRGHEPLRRRIVNKFPKYGNDLDEPDDLARRWAGYIIEMSEAQTVGPHRYVPGFFCWIMHERIGSQTGATPDGRCAGLPLADAAGAAQGRELCGPTASVLSTTKWSHRAALGGLVHNAKFSRELLETGEGRAALRSLIETYLLRGGFEMQVNIVSRETLLEAREHPEQYRDLLVRVAGYSDYFVKLNPKIQEEIIARTEHRM